MEEGIEELGRGCGGWGARREAEGGLDDLAEEKRKERSDGDDSERLLKPLTGRR